MKKDDTVIEGERERDADASLRCSDAFIVWTPMARERGHGPGTLHVLGKYICGLGSPLEFPFPS